MGWGDGGWLVCLGFGLGFGVLVGVGFGIRFGFGTWYFGNWFVISELVRGFVVFCLVCWFGVCGLLSGFRN